MTKEEFWNEFKRFKGQVLSMKIEDVRKKTVEYKSKVKDYYSSQELITKIENQIVEQVAKVLNVKKNFVTKDHEILGWKMPSDFIPYVENGESPEMLPKRLYDAYMAMLSSSEFCMLCDSNIQYTKEYDRFLIDWCSKCYGIDRRIVEQNMNNTVEYIANQVNLLNQKLEI